MVPCHSWSHFLLTHIKLIGHTQTEVGIFSARITCLLWFLRWACYTMTPKLYILLYISNSTIQCKWLCLGAHAPKAYGSWFMYLSFCVHCICMSVTPISWRLLKTKRWQMQCRHSTTNLIVLDFWIKAWFSIYGILCSSWMPLWCVPDSGSPKDKSAHNKSPCNWNLYQYCYIYNRYICWQQNKLS